MSKRSLLVPGIILFIVGAVAFGFMLREWDDVGRCLDRGGSYDYEKGLCDLEESHPVRGALGSPMAIIALFGVGLGGGFIAGASVKKDAL